MGKKGPAWVSIVPFGYSMKDGYSLFDDMFIKELILVNGSAGRA